MNAHNKSRKDKININIIKILKKSGDFTDKELATIALKMAISDVIPNTLVAPAQARAKLKGMKEMFDKLVSFVGGEPYWNEKNAHKYHKDL